MVLDKRLRFSIKDDLVLLRQVIAANPYDDICQWKQVHEKTVMVTGKNYSLRAIKEHVGHLLKLWTKADTWNLRKSGTEEQYEEKEHLLHTISRLIDDSGAKKSLHEVKKRGLDNITTLLNDDKSFVFTYHPIVIKEPNTRFSNVQVSQPSTLSDPQLSEQTEFSDPQVPQQTDFPDPQILQQTNFPESQVLQQTSLPDPQVSEQTEFSDPQLSQQTSLPDPDNDEEMGSVKKKRCKDGMLKSSLLKYLNKRQEEERNLKKKELQIEETKLNVEKKKVELEERRVKLQEDKWRMEERERKARLEADIAERKERLAMELEERRQRMHQSEQQQKLMELMFQFFTKNNV